MDCLKLQDNVPIAGNNVPIAALKPFLKNILKLRLSQLSEANFSSYKIPSNIAQFLLLIQTKREPR